MDYLKKILKCVNDIKNLLEDIKKQNTYILRELKKTELEKAMEMNGYKIKDGEND